MLRNGRRQVLKCRCYRWFVRPWPVMLSCQELFTPPGVESNSAVKGVLHCGSAATDSMAPYHTGVRLRFGLGRSELKDKCQSSESFIHCLKQDFQDSGAACSDGWSRSRELPSTLSASNCDTAAFSVSSGYFETKTSHSGIPKDSNWELERLGVVHCSPQIKVVWQRSGLNNG